MPTFQGQVSEDNILQLIAYIKSLAATPEGKTTDAQATANAENKPAVSDENGQEGSSSEKQEDAQEQHSGSDEPDEAQPTDDQRTM